MTKRVVGINVDMVQAHMAGAVALIRTATTPEAWKEVADSLTRAANAAKRVAEELQSSANQPVKNRAEK